MNRRAGKFLVGELSGFDVVYNSDAKAAAASGRLSPGVRVPDIELAVEDGSSATLYSYLTSGHRLHLSFVPGASACGPDWLRPHRIKAVAASLSTHTALRAVNALLVRPDGYVSAIEQE